MNKNANPIKWAIASVLLATTMVVSLKVSSSERKEADVILSNRNTVVFRGAVTDDTVRDCIKKLRELDAQGSPDSPIYLALNTPGGSIQSGIELIETVKGMRRPVKTITIFAASMGFQIAQNLDDRLILSGGVLMSHKARGGEEGEFGPGSNSQLDNRLNFWKSRLLEMDKKTVERTHGKQTLQTYQASYENELWLTGSEAVSGGYADRVVTVRCNRTLDGTENEEVNFLGMKFSIKFSKCPLQTAPENVDAKIKTNQGFMSTEDFAINGGVLGVDCLTAHSRISPIGGTVLCAIDASITKEKLEVERKKIIRSYTTGGLRENVGYTW